MPLAQKLRLDITEWVSGKWGVSLGKRFPQEYPPRRSAGPAGRRAHRQLQFSSRGEQRPPVSARAVSRGGPPLSAGAGMGGGQVSVARAAGQLEGFPC